MTDTNIGADSGGSAVVFPQDDGTGVPSGEEDGDYAALFGILARYTDGTYRDTGLELTNVDTTSDTADVTAGVAFIEDDASVTNSGRSGLPAFGADATTDTYGTTLPDPMPTVVILPSDVTLSMADGSNDVYLAVDPTANDKVYVRHGTSVSAPSDPSIKLGTADTSAGSTSQANSEWTLSHSADFDGNEVRDVGSIRAGESGDPSLNPGAPFTLDGADLKFNAITGTPTMGGHDHSEGGMAAVSAAGMDLGTGVENNAGSLRVDEDYDFSFTSQIDLNGGASFSADADLNSNDLVDVGSIRDADTGDPSLTPGTPFTLDGADLKFNSITGTPTMGNHDHSEGGMATVPAGGLNLGTGVEDNTGSLRVDEDYDFTFTSQVDFSGGASFGSALDLNGNAIEDASRGYVAIGSSDDLRLATGQAIEDGGGTQRLLIGSARTRLMDDAGLNVIRGESNNYNRVIGRSGQPIVLYDAEGSFDAVQYTTDASTGTLELTNAKVDINDQSTDPASDGEITRNGSDVKVHSGGSVRNLSDVGGGGGPVAVYDTDGNETLKSRDTDVQNVSSNPAWRITEAGTMMPLRISTNDDDPNLEVDGESIQLQTVNNNVTKPDYYFTPHISFENYFEINISTVDGSRDLAIEGWQIT